MGAGCGREISVAGSPVVSWPFKFPRLPGRFNEKGKAAAVPGCPLGCPADVAGGTYGGMSIGAALALAETDL